MGDTDGDERAALIARIEKNKLNTAEDKNIIEKLSNRVESLTEEMFATANDKVMTAEMARADAEEQQKEAEKRRKEVESRMSVLVREMEELKATVGDGAIESISSSGNHSITNTSILMDASFLALKAYEFKNTESGVEPILWSEFVGLLSACSDVKLMFKTPYWERCMREDIEPCWGGLGIENKTELLEMFSTNDLLIRPTPAGAPQKSLCSLSGRSEVCEYEIKCICTSPVLFPEFSPVCSTVYRSLTVVADLVSALRYLSRGLIDTTPVAAYPILNELRMHITAVRLGWSRKEPAS
eukprot:CFRG2917T1